MSSVSVDSALIQKLIKNCSDTISRLEKTKQGLVSKYQSLGSSWSDSKYQYLGFNDGRHSHVLVGTGHEEATTVHENLHQLSANGSRHGIIERSYGNRHNVQMNEAITEMLTRRTLGSDYGEDYSLYSENRDAMELIESCMGSETIYEAYFQNRPELMRNQFESVMGTGSWTQLSDAFDDCTSNLPHDRTIGRTRRNNLIDEYMRLSASNSPNSQQSWRDML